LNSLLNRREAQYSFNGDTRQRRASGNGVGDRDICGKVAKNLSDWFLESMSAALAAPAIWVAVMRMSKTAVKNHRHLIRCITVLSDDEPLLIVATKPRLSQ